MITFLVEVDEHGDFVHDFTWSLFRSIDYNSWYYNKDSNYKLVKVKQKDEKEIFTFNIGNQNVIPVGSLEFVHRYMVKKGLNIPIPLNIPTELRKYEYIKRHIYEDTLNNIKWNKKWFIKPASDVKKFTGFVAESLENVKLFEPNITEDDMLFISDPINIISEYRCIVHNDELKCIQNYQGDFTYFPNIKIINNIISDYKNYLPIYTLDIGITDKGETVIIELHHFYSCGLYGFNDLCKIPEMFSDWWYWYCKK